MVDDEQEKRWECRVLFDLLIVLVPAYAFC
jgi:hypothetical protein